MAVELVIKISKECYENLLKNHRFSSEEIPIISLAIATGTPQPRKGHWILRPHIYGVAFCSECGFELKINNTNYCPNCGAKMVCSQESEDKE